VVVVGVASVVAGSQAALSALFASGCVAVFLGLQHIGIVAVRRGTALGLGIMGAAFLARFAILTGVLWFATTNGLFRSADERLWFFLAGGLVTVCGLVAALAPASRDRAADVDYQPHPDWKEQA
jgi:hypothetical protein